jgi:colicin import membrane protein
MCTCATGLTGIYSPTLLNPKMTYVGGCGRALAARLSERVSALVGAEQAARADAEAVAAKFGTLSAQAAALRAQLADKDGALQQLTALLNQRTSMQQQEPAALAASPAAEAAATPERPQSAWLSIVQRAEEPNLAPRGEAKDARIAWLESELRGAAREVAAAHAKLRKAEDHASHSRLPEQPRSGRSSSIIVSMSARREEAAALARRAEAADRAAAAADAGRADAERAAQAAAAKAARLQVASRMHHPTWIHVGIRGFTCF